MKLSIITPTLLRPSLARTCASIEEQSCREWEHVVAVDVADPDMALIGELTHPNRRFVFCGTRHRDGGNTCRHNAWASAQGDYIYYLDDDNYLHDSDAIGRMLEAVEESVDVAVAFFPIIRLGQRFFPPDPPQECHVDTANVLAARSIARWPQTAAYGSDWLLVERLIRDHPYRMFPEVEPVAVLPVISGAK